MDPNSSISSFRLNWPVFLSMSFLILAIEVISYSLRGNIQIGEIVYRTLYESQVHNGITQRDYSLLIGGSVGRPLAFNIAEYPNTHLLDLTTVTSTGPIGQYFLIQRAIENYGPPQKVIYIGIPIREQFVDFEFFESHVIKVFTEFDEIAELFWATKSLVVLAKSLSYKILPTFAYRTGIQERSLFKMPTIHWTAELDPYQRAPSPYSLFQLGPLTPPLGLTDLYIDKILTFLAEKNINFYFFQMPLNKENAMDIKRYNEWTNEKVQLYERHANFYYLLNHQFLPNSFFKDPWHLNDEGLLLVQKYYHPLIRDLYQRNIWHKQIPNIK